MAAPFATLANAQDPGDPDILETAFKRRGWLATATPGHRAQILAAGRRVRLLPGERLFSAGAQPGGIYGVISGGIAAEGGSAWHAPRIGHVLRSGHWFGHGPALAGGERKMGYLALEHSELLTVPLADLRALMREHPEIALRLGEMANLGTILTTWTACDLLIPDAPRRIAAVLLRVTGAHEGVEPQDRQGFLLTQSVLGEMANASRNHVNRVLGQFAQSGWIAKSYSHIRIMDIAALSAFAYSEN